VKVFVSTADASGDLHAAAVVDALRRKEPGLEVFGLGGRALEASGLEPVVRQSDFAVAGLVEILSSVPHLLAGYTRLRSALTRRSPDVAILVDSPDLNLPLASVAQRSGVPVLYYVVPQVWAWRPGRLRKLRRRVDRAAVIFPFEEGLLRGAGIDAAYVGHPLVERLADFRRAFDPESFAAGLGLDPERPVLGLLPGSRRNELHWNLPLMLEAASIARRSLPDLQTLLVVAPSLRDLPLEVPSDVRVVHDESHAAMAVSTVLLSAPGTATVEATILGVPFVVTHRVNPLSYAVGQRVVRVASSCMANLVAGSGVVPERLQAQARPASLAGLLLGLLRNEKDRDQLRQRLEDTAARLGGPGASERTAEMVRELVRRT
jgi:lipid-A-disaccharide synthase